MRKLISCLLAAGVVLAPQAPSNTPPTPQPPPAPASAPEPPRGREPALRLRLVSTAYNSEAAQTDATPFVTATGSRARMGVVAVSRDLLRGPLPYGSRVRIVAAGPLAANSGRCQPEVWRGRVFTVEDTMHPRKRGQIDIWLPDRRKALEWGRCRVLVEVVSPGPGRRPAR